MVSLWCFRIKTKSCTNNTINKVTIKSIYKETVITQHMGGGDNPSHEAPLYKIWGNEKANDDQKIHLLNKDKTNVRAVNRGSGWKLCDFSENSDEQLCSAWGAWKLGVLKDWRKQFLQGSLRYNENWNLRDVYFCVLVLNLFRMLTQLQKHISLLSCW